MSENKFLPICKKDMEERGWEQLDFVYISGDAYVDHPSFGHAIITRLLEAHGFKVGIIAQEQHYDPWRTETGISCFCGKYGFDGESLFRVEKASQNGCLYAGRRDGKASGLRSGCIQ